MVLGNADPSCGQGAPAANAAQGSTSNLAERCACNIGRCFANQSHAFVYYWKGVHVWSFKASHATTQNMMKMATETLIGGPHITDLMTFGFDNTGIPPPGPSAKPSSASDGSGRGSDNNDDPEPHRRSKADDRGGVHSPPGSLLAL